MQGWWLVREKADAGLRVPSPLFLAGAALWAMGLHVNLRSDAILRNLRRPGVAGAFLSHYSGSTALPDLLNPTTPEQPPGCRPVLSLCMTLLQRTSRRRAYVRCAATQSMFEFSVHTLYLQKQLVNPYADIPTCFESLPVSQH